MSPLMVFACLVGALFAFWLIHDAVKLWHNRLRFGRCPKCKQIFGYVQARCEGKELMIRCGTCGWTWRKWS